MVRPVAVVAAAAPAHAALRPGRPGLGPATGLAGPSKALGPRGKVVPKGDPRAKVVPRESAVPQRKAGATRAAQAAGAASLTAAVALAPPPGRSVIGPAQPNALCGPRPAKARLGAL